MVYVTRKNTREKRKMFCKKCGNELPDNAMFCPKCGNKTGNERQAEITNENNNIWKDHKNKIIIGAVVGVAVILCIILIFIISWSDRQDGKIMDAVMNTGIETETSAEAGPQLYDVTQDTIDVYAENRQPNARDFSLVWDKSLFYTLEDVTAEDTDGQIEKYDVLKK